MTSSTAAQTSELDLWPIGNCQVSGLIDRSGALVWGCVPRFDGDYLDASLLQMVELRFLKPDNPRFQSTFAAIEKYLRRGEHMLRYSSEDDFGLPETAFNVSTFWLIEALHLAGRDKEACALFEAVLGHRTASGMLSEDMNFETGELWGNFPQTYSLVGVINCTNLLSRKSSEVR